MSQTGSYVTALVWETSDAEGPTRAEYQTNWNAMDGHLHDNRGAGRGIRGIQTTSVPTQTGDMQINGDSLQWWGATSSAVITAVNPNVAVSSLLFSGPAGVANSRFVGIVSASGAPTTGTWQKYDYGYDEAGNIWLCTVAGSPGTWVKAGGPTLPLTLANGGTGVTTLANHGLVVAGASTLATVAPGASGNVLKSNGTDWTSGAAATNPVTFSSLVTTGVSVGTVSPGITVYLTDTKTTSGGDIYVVCSATSLGSGNPNPSFFVRIDSGAWQTLGVTNNNSTNAFCGIWHFAGVSAASHTIDIGANIAATGTINMQPFGFFGFERF